MDQKPFATLNEVKAVLGIRPALTDMDARLTLFISTATKAIEKETGRNFTKQAHTEFFTSRDNSKLNYDFGPSFGYTPETMD